VILSKTSFEVGRMNRLGKIALSLIFALTAPGCSVPLAPGAEQVKITRNPADVTGCKAVGNLDPINGGGVANQGRARNQAIGLGGDTLFDTAPPLAEALGGHMEGIVYLCHGNVTAPAN
jgi:hypothetical protein